MASDRWLSSWALGSVAFGATSLLIPLYFVSIGGSTLLLDVLAGTAATAIVTRLAPPAIRGEALGLYTALSGLATGIRSVAGGWLGAYGFTLTFGVAGGFVFVGTALVTVIWRHTSGSEPAAPTASESL